jgi:outer membrane protein assembly factor BamB
MIPPDVQVSITCLDAQNGKEQWSSSFARNLRPYRCEVYKGRVVVFLSGIREVFGELNSTMVFLDSRTGKPMAPFDTRNFVYKDDDPQIRRSRLGSQGSVYEERSELLLPNGWVSYGVARLPWWNARSNNVYFFDRRTWDLAWTVTLPEGAYNLSHWRDILVFCKTRDENGKWTSRLYAQPAGSPVPTWEFTLPKDIPDRESETFDAPGPPKIVRAFSYTVGSRSVFAFGNGAVFALEPRSGKVLWRHVVRDEKVKGDSFSYGEVIETEANILLASGSVLARLDESSGGKLSVLRRDLYNGPTPVCVGTGVYCFTER